MAKDSVVYLDKAMSPANIQERLTHLRANWRELNETAVQVLELAQHFYNEENYKKAYVFTVLAESYIVAPQNKQLEELDYDKRKMD